MPQREADDEGVLDDVGEVIDDVLGENLPEPEAEDRGSAGCGSSTR